MWVGAYPLSDLLCPLTRIVRVRPPLYRRFLLTWPTVLAATRWGARLQSECDDSVSAMSEPAGSGTTEGCERATPVGPERRGSCAVDQDQPARSLQRAGHGAVAQGIESAIDEPEADDEVWVGIITGEPPVLGRRRPEGDQRRQRRQPPDRAGCSPASSSASGANPHRRGRRAGAGGWWRSSWRATWWWRRQPPRSASPRSSGRSWSARMPSGTEAAPFNLAMELALTGDPSAPSWLTTTGSSTGWSSRDRRSTPRWPGRADRANAPLAVRA